MTDPSEAPMQRWAAVLDAAWQGARVTQVVWVGDSLSELNWDAPAVPWQVGDLLAGRTEPVQYRNATADLYSQNMRTDGRSLEGADAGLGGRAVELASGQTTSFDAGGEGVSVLWIRQPGGGELQVRWGDELLGTFDTGAPDVGTEVTSLPRRGGLDTAEIELTAVGAAVRVAGIYVHNANLHAGVRVWPAVRSGNKSRWFTEQANWLIEPLAALVPDLVVLATGTNDDDYELEITHLVRTAREHAPGADIALWLPPLNQRFTLERAAIGREVARREGCGLIDAARDLGALPTTDGVHPTPFTVALGAAHAATVLGGPGASGWWSALIEANRSLAEGQRWGGNGGGVVEVDLVLGLATIAGKVRSDDAGAAWVLALPPLPMVAAGLDGAVLGLGPGGAEHPDTFLSRLAPGRFAVNGGRGALELERIVMRVDGAPEGSDATVSLHASRDRDGATEVVALASDGSRWRVTASPSGLELPLPCALSAHLHPTVPYEPAADQVLWVPMPALAQRAVATRIWLEVLRPASGAGATAGVVGRGAPGRPGHLLGRTDVGAIDCGATGVVGAELGEPVLVEPGLAWWIGLHLTGDGSSGLVISGAATLRGGAGVQAAPAGAIPSADPVSGAVTARSVGGLPPSAPDEVASLLGPAPAVHVSLEAPSADGPR